MNEQLEQHPLSAAWPAMGDSEWQEFLDDVKANGIREPILLHEGQILDGWHRYRASQELGRTCPMDQWDPSLDPVALVISRNAARRNITAKEKAKAVLICRGYRKHGERDSRVAIVATLDNSIPGNEQSRSYPKQAPKLEDLAREAGVSERTVRTAQRELEQDKPEPPREPKRRSTPTMAERLED